MNELSNEKTKKELGLQYILNSIDLLTPFGRKRIESLRPFLPGSEGQLVRELNKLEDIKAIIDKYPDAIDSIVGVFMQIKDNTYTIERSGMDVLTSVELFEIKAYLLHMENLSKVYADIQDDLPDEYILEDTKDLLDLMDPENSRLATFYIYDSFSEKLTDYRHEKKDLEKRIKKEQRVLKDKILKEHGIAITPKFDISVSRSDEEILEKIKKVPELVQGSEDYTSVTFVLNKTDIQVKTKEKIEELNAKIEAEEYKVRKMLTEEINKYQDSLITNSRKIGDLDFVMGKAQHAKKHDCVKPEILQQHKVSITKGRYIPVEDALEEKGKSYHPIDVFLNDGVACITGANMGGKTVSMKLIGFMCMLTQYGFFVPCEQCAIGLSAYIRILVGDSQDIQKGLSSFGSEMEELKNILDECKSRSIILIDEIASSTNPSEGFALTKSLIEYLKVKDSITLITTHFEDINIIPGIKSLQVRGLANADFAKLSEELLNADEYDRIDVISKYMDYSLDDTDIEAEIPKDALNIALMLGVNAEIIEEAKKIMEDKGKGRRI